MSKLLKRLAHLGLVQNTGAGGLTGKPRKGNPHSWRLTGKGAEVLRELEGVSAA